MAWGLGPFGPSELQLVGGKIATDIPLLFFSLPLSLLFLFLSLFIILSYFVMVGGGGDSWDPRPFRPLICFFPPPFFSPSSSSSSSFFPFLSSSPFPSFPSLSFFFLRGGGGGGKALPAPGSASAFRGVAAPVVS